MRNGTSSLTRWLEIPDGSAESWVFDDFRSSERHVPRRGKRRRRRGKFPAKPRLYVLNRHVRAQDNEPKADFGKHDKMTSRFILGKFLVSPMRQEKLFALFPVTKAYVCP